MQAFKLEAEEQDMLDDCIFGVTATREVNVAVEWDSGHIAEVSCSCCVAFNHRRVVIISATLVDEQIVLEFMKPFDILETILWGKAWLWHSRKVRPLPHPRLIDDILIHDEAAR